MNEILPIAPEPRVFERNGAVFANSRDVAAHFEKAHRHVLEAIDNLLISLAAENSATLFISTLAYDPSANRETRSFDMTRDGFTLLAMGFTGPKALAFKLAYLAQFNAMESALRERPALPDLSDPLVLQHLLSQHITARIAADQRAAVAEKAVEAAQETVNAHNRIAGAEGTMCITDAAKVLQLKPSKLFGWMSANKWIFHRAGKAAWLSYQDRIQSGDLTHRVHVQPQEDGTDKVRESVHVTMSGLAKLAKRVPGAKPVSQIDLFHTATHKVPKVTM